MHIYELNTDGYDSRFTEFIKLRTKALYKDMKTIAELIRDDIQGNILNKRAVPSGKLADNRPSVIAKKGFNAPMFETGKLHDSISVQSIQDGYEVYIEGKENQDKAFYNSYDRYMRQVFGKYIGFDIKRRNKSGTIKVPARKFFGIRTAIKKDIQRILDGR